MNQRLKDLLQKGQAINTKIEDLKKELARVERGLITYASKERQASAKKTINLELDDIKAKVEWKTRYVVDLNSANALKDELGMELWGQLFSERVVINRARSWDHTLNNLMGHVDLAGSVTRIEAAVDVVDSDEPSVSWKNNGK